MDRRHFIQTTIGTVTALSCLQHKRLFAAPESDEIIVVAKGTEIVNMVRNGINALGGISRFVKSGQTVVIKPNFSWANDPERATTTNPYVIGALVGLCRDAGAKEIKVIDNTCVAAGMCLHKTGILRETEAAGGKAFGIKDFRNVQVNGQFLKSISFSSDALDADVLINVPVAKDCSESRVGVSIGLKGYMGLIKERSSFHANKEGTIHESISDLMCVRKPDLTIVDGIFVLMDGGPRGPGKVKQANTLLFGTDPVALDALAIKELLERNPAEVPHITLSHRRHGNMNYQAFTRVNV